MEQKLYEAASALPEPALDFHDIQQTPRRKTAGWSLRAIASLAACLILVFSVCLVTVEAMEYSNAIKFFNEYGLSADGLSRGEIKAVYRDIITESFTYAKTAEVIANSLTADQVGGYEILQDDPTPEEVEQIWNDRNFVSGFLLQEPTGIHYRCDTEYNEEDPDHVYFEQSYVEQYDGNTLIWHTTVPGLALYECYAVSDGVIACGDTESYWSQPWIVKISSDGDIQWKRKLNNGEDHEFLAKIIENPDGTYALFSRCDSRYFCLSLFTADGEAVSSCKTEIGAYGIRNVARFGDGYLVQLYSYTENEHARIVKVDGAGNITDSFSYSSGDAYYHITDMAEFNGNIYLSAYAVPKSSDADESTGSRYEIDPILDYIFDNDLWNISSEELTPMVRDNYTAILLVCDPNVGTPQEFYSVEGSLGGTLSLNDAGMLLWDVESITTTFYSPATSSFTIGGTSYIFRYTIDRNGTLVSQEKTGETVNYRR